MTDFEARLVGRTVVVETDSLVFGADGKTLVETVDAETVTLKLIGKPSRVKISKASVRKVVLVR